MISLDYRDPRPVYEQVKAGLIRLIASRALVSGEKLPSVRELASQLALNPNTIQRAYRDLETEGYISSAPGKGSFVTDSGETTRRRRAELYAQLDSVAAELKTMGEPATAIAAHITGGSEEA